MTYTEEKYKKQIKSYSDAKITVEVKQLNALRPEIALLLVNEAQARKLELKEIDDFVNSDQYLSQEELDKWISHVQNLPCPLCIMLGPFR